MRIQKSIIVCSVLMAIFGAGIGMLKNSHQADAAIFVVDAENILQATKTAVNTASILSEEEKQVALQIIELASLPSEQRVTFLRNILKQQEAIKKEQQEKEGALDSKKSSETFWKENFDGIDKILSGNITPQTAYEFHQRRIKNMEKNSKDSLRNAKNAQDVGNQINDTVENAATSSSNASGTKEAIQANTQTVAAAAMGTVVGNNLLADLVAAQAVKQQKEIEEEAHAMSMQKQAAELARNNVNAMKAAAVK